MIPALRYLTLTLFLLVHAPLSFAQTYPAKPLRIVVPYAPGGAVDILAREIGQKLTESWGQQVIVDNRPGASGMIGSELGSRAQADGYTLLMGTAGSHAMNPSMYPKIPYDSIRDFTPIILVSSVTNILVINAQVPAGSVKELIALARAKPGELKYASLGNGTSQHLSAELFRIMAGVDMLHVPYKGVPQALTDLVNGQVSLMFTGMAATLPFVKQGRLKALAVTTGRRAGALPELPTVAEAGLPGYESNNWVGMFAPAQTAPAIVARLNAEVTKILSMREMKERFLTQGDDFSANTPGEFAQYLKAEIAKWGQLVKQAGIRPD